MGRICAIFAFIIISSFCYVEICWALRPDQYPALVKSIKEDAQSCIAPWNPTHSKGGMNFDSRYGSPDWTISLDGKNCKIKLVFPKGPFYSKNEAADFQMELVGSVLKSCRKMGFDPETISIKMYSKGGKKYEGIATSNKSDDKIRWREK